MLGTLALARYIDIASAAADPLKHEAAMFNRTLPQAGDTARS
jgi:hypothetical protein